MPVPAMPPAISAPAAPAAQLSSQQQIDLLLAQATAMKAPAYQKYLDWKIAHYQEGIHLSEYRTRMYDWQLHAGQVMLWTSVAVVFAGLGLSAAQLIHSLKLGKNEDGSIDMSITGLKVTSSVTGILILGMSLGFIYIFVQQVYAIHEPVMPTINDPLKDVATQTKGS